MSLRSCKVYKCHPAIISYVPVDPANSRIVISVPGRITAVSFAVDVSKIQQSVIVSDAIDMVNVSLWIFPIRQSPSYPVRLHEAALNAYLNVPFLIQPARLFTTKSRMPCFAYSFG
ncbi:hypothetical protein OJE16_09900 [Pantoea tagorei]